MLALVGILSTTLCFKLSFSLSRQTVLFRLYQPEKMAQFDRFFARSWATPVRRVLPAEQNEGSDDENDFSGFRRNISGRLPTPGVSQDEEKTNETARSLASFMDEHGFEPSIETSLNMFVQYHSTIDRLRSPSSGT